HSSNPDDNLQWHSSAETIALFKRYGDWHQRLLPYFLQIVDDAVSLGLPPVRPIWWGAENAAELYDVEDQILIGQDLLLAPIIEESSTQRTVVIPAGSTWRRWLDYEAHFGEVLTPGSHTLSADVDDTILLVRTGSVLPVLTQVYDTLALERQGDDYAESLDPAPINITAIGLLMSVGGDGKGNFSHPDFGSIKWEIQSSAFDTATCDAVQVNGNPLVGCAGDDSINCFAGNRIELRGELTSAQEVICASESQSMTLNLEVSGLGKIFIEIR
ncbi:MAG: glycoside hydrolase family 31 protein, partial [Myxococcota bacterium]|nr:glycoside hydrolase family 31 protein [Myxococcota bacterium]